MLYKLLYEYVCFPQYAEDTIAANGYLELIMYFCTDLVREGILFSKLRERHMLLRMELDLNLSRLVLAPWSKPPHCPVPPPVGCHLPPASSLSTGSGDKLPVGLPQQGADPSPSPSLSLRCHSARLCMPTMLRTQMNSASMPMTLSI